MLRFIYNIYHSFNTVSPHLMKFLLCFSGRQLHCLKYNEFCSDKTWSGSKDHIMLWSCLDFYYIWLYFFIIWNQVNVAFKIWCYQPMTFWYLYLINLYHNFINNSAKLTNMTFWYHICILAIYNIFLATRSKMDIVQ